MPHWEMDNRLGSRQSVKVCERLRGEMKVTSLKENGIQREQLPLDPGVFPGGQGSVQRELP